MNVSFGGMGGGKFINEYKHLVGVEVKEIEPHSNGRKQWALNEMQETPLKCRKKGFSLCI